MLERRYEDLDAAWADLYGYECGGCGHRNRKEDAQGQGTYPNTPLYRSVPAPRGTAGHCVCPDCGTGFDGKPYATTEYAFDTPVRRFVTVAGRCPACGLGYDAKAGGMEYSYEDASDERDGLE